MVQEQASTPLAPFDTYESLPLWVKAFDERGPLHLQVALNDFLETVQSGGGFIESVRTRPYVVPSDTGGEAWFFAIVTYRAKAMVG